MLKADSSEPPITRIECVDLKAHSMRVAAGWLTQVDHPLLTPSLRGNSLTEQMRQGKRVSRQAALEVSVPGQLQALPAFSLWTSAKRFESAWMLRLVSAKPQLNDCIYPITSRFLATRARG